MKLIDRLERMLGKFYISNLIKYICFGTLGVFILDYLPLNASASGMLYFNRNLILQGQVWRLITFVFLPKMSNILFFLFGLYLSYLIGTCLENRWGSRRFFLFYLIGVLGNIAAGFIVGTTTNEYLNLSLFFAFAVLYPDFRLNLFFILPVKIKWLALLDAAFFIYRFLWGGWTEKIIIVLSLLPFLLFFARDAYLSVKMDLRRLQYWWRSRQ